MENSQRQFFNRWTPRMLSILRIVFAFLIMQHGAQKVFGVLLTEQVTMRPPLFSILGVAGLIEFFGGLLVLVGLFTRPAAFILSGQMAVAYFMAHAPLGFWPIQNHGELAVAYCFAFLFLATAGGGSWSLDHLWNPDSAPTVRPLGSV